MASNQDNTIVSPGDDSDKEYITVSVRISTEDDKLIRRAAVELDTTRSEFMADLAVRRAREVLQQHQPAKAS